MKYQIYSALHPETDKGWIWALDKRFKSRSTVRISNESRSIYCEYRELDEAFITIYNEQTHTVKIDPEKTYKNSQFFQMKDRKNFENILVIGDWYRQALGGFGSSFKMTIPIELTIDPPRWSLWADFKATCHHPEPSVRVGMKLGILGIWLGLIGGLFAIVTPTSCSRVSLDLVVGIATGLLAVWAVKGISRG